MHTFTRMSVAALFVLWKTLSGSAQNIVVSDGITIRNDYGYEIIGRLRDRILLFRDKYDEFEVQAFDSQMKLSWNRELEDIDKRGVQILAVVGGKNDFSVIFKLRRRGINTLRIHKYDPGANLIDSMTIKDYGERVFMPPSLDYVLSEDRNCILVYNDAESDRLEALCFRLDKMQVLWEKNVLLGNYDSYESNTKMTLSNQGEFYLIQYKNSRRNKAENNVISILRIKGESERLTFIPMRNTYTCDAAFAFDNQYQRLACGGLYGDRNKERANGVFYFTLRSTDSLPTVHMEPFEDKLISVLRQKDVEDDTKGINHCNVRQLILRRDGGVVMMVERNHEIHRGAAAGRGFLRDGMRMVVDFYYDDLFAVAINPDGTSHWKTVLHKKQYSQDDEGTFSSYFLFRNSDKMRILFNDEIKYENTCSEYVLSPVGEFDRNSLMSTNGQSLRLRFKDGLQITANECLIPSEFRNRLRLVLLQY